MSKFVMKADSPRETLGWGSLRWLSHPPTTKTKNLTVIEAEMNPGMGHNFHRHPDQEEVIYCIRGQVEPWVDHEKQILGPGDSVYIDTDVVHASFNVGTEPAHKVPPITGAFLMRV